MRIAFLADASLPHTMRWVGYFAGAGHDALLLSLEPGAGYTCETMWLPGRRALPRFLRYTLAIPAARRALRAFRPDVVNAHFLPNYGWMAAHARHNGKGVPVALTVLGSDILTVPQQTPLHAWRTRWVLQRCDAVTSDAHMLTAAVAAFGFARERILTVPLGIELQRFPFPASRPEPGPDVPCVVLSSRRLDPVYDIATLLRAWPQVSSPRQSLQLQVAGSGSEETTLRTLLPPDQVTFLGWLTMPQLDEALRRAHVYVSTSLSDSTSVSLLEAMAAGCFPVVSDIPGNREWIEHGRNGLLFPIGDATALARALERAIQDSALRQGSVALNRRRVEERASWQDNMRAVDALFQSLRAP